MENRRPLLLMTPLVILFGVYVMVTGQVGRGQLPLTGWPARLIGASFTTLGVVVFVMVWRQPSER